jgi:hypothetical protein
MVRKMVELPKFLVFNSRTNSFGNSSVFTFYLLLFALYRFLYLLFEFLIMGFVTFFMSVFQMELSDYPHFNLVEDRTLCSMGQHCLGFPREPTAHDMDQCEVSVMIPFDPMEPWSGSIISSEPDTGVELMAHITLTSLCEDRLAAAAELTIALLLIRDQENPVWQQRLEAMSNHKGPHFHTWDDFIGQVRAVPIQPSAQHCQDRHVIAYASDGVQGECHCRHPRD